MPRKLYGLTEDDRRRLRDTVGRVRAGRGSARPVPTRRRVIASEGAAADLIATGVVESGTAATSDQSGNDLTLGTVSLWKYLTADQLDRFDDAEAYDVDKPIYLTANPHDDATAYADGDWVTESGNVYSADGAVAAGTFDVADWILVDSEGVKFANTSVSAGAYDDTEWGSATGTKFIDRTRATVDLDHHFEGDPPTEGAIAKWIGTRLIGFGCAAQEGWA